MGLDTNPWDSALFNLQAPFPVPKRRSGVSDEDFEAFERRYEVTLPALMKEMYRIQNGGWLRDADQDVVEELASFETDVEKPSDWGKVCSFQEFFKTDYSPLSEIHLEGIEEEFGNPRRVIFFASAAGGHISYGLNFNRTNGDGEPEVMSYDNEGGNSGKVAETFEEWIRELKNSDDQPAVDWSERERRPVLFESVFETYGPLGQKCRGEQALYSDGKRGLIILQREVEGERVLKIERAVLPDGVARLWLRVSNEQSFGGAYTLRVDPLYERSCESMECVRLSNDQWRNKPFETFSIIRYILSNDRDELMKLAERLEGEGYARS